MRRPVERTIIAVSLVANIALTTFDIGCGRAAEPPQSLQLDVVINDIPSNKISAFVLTDENRMASTAHELEDIGIVIDAAKEPDDLIMLDTIPGLNYTYEAPMQRIRLVLDAKRLKPKSYSQDKKSRDTVRPRSDWGSLLSYDIYTSTETAHGLGQLGIPSNSLQLLGRMFSPYGYVEQSGLLRSTGFGDPQFLRLDTSYHYSDPDSLVSYTAGDLVSGGLSWTRSIRLGGLQARSNFNMRPDLITSPMLSLGGTAQVPSTVDVYINNIRTLSQQVDQGPFVLTDIPALSGSGQAQVVIRDAAGQESRSSTPFYSSPNLLAVDLTSWSIEAGAPRLAYGSTADGYSSNYAVSATMRRGIFQWLTLETHLEGAQTIANGGMGVAMNAGPLGIISGAYATSRSDIGNGSQATVSFQKSFLGATLSASSQRAFKRFDDLAGSTARAQPSSGTTPDNSSYLAQLFTSYGVPRELDSVNLSVPDFFDRKSDIGLGFVHTTDASGVKSGVLQATYSKTLPNDMAFSASAFRSLGANPNTGIFLSLSFRLGQNTTVSGSSNNGIVTGRFDATRQLDAETGSIGWHVTDSEGRTASRTAQLSYRSPVGVVEATAYNGASLDAGTLRLRGAISSLDGRIFGSDWVNDSFVVVKTDKPGVTVYQDNRKVGQTGQDGTLILSQMPSYVRSNISIDPTGMPVDAEITETTHAVNPADHSGQIVEFRVNSVSNSALVTFNLPDGTHVPAGSAGTLQGGGTFVVGYDGQAYIKGLTAANTATIELSSGSCLAQFGFKEQPGVQVHLQAIECK